MDQDEVYAVYSYSDGRRYFGDVDGEKNGTGFG